VWNTAVSDQSSVESGFRVPIQGTSVFMAEKPTKYRIGCDTFSGKKISHVLAKSLGILKLIFMS
jgi:hypothetical protein